MISKKLGRDDWHILLGSLENERMWWCDVVCEEKRKRYILCQPSMRGRTAELNWRKLFSGSRPNGATGFDCNEYEYQIN